MRTQRLLTFLLLTPFLLPAQKKDSRYSQPPNREASKTRAVTELARLSEISGGTLGISALHIETGASLTQNADVPFGMASTYKVPIAVQLLSRVDSGVLLLDQMVELKASDLHWGSGMLSERFNWPNSPTPGVALSIRSLLELMMLISDNSATDICLRLAGGPALVNAKLRREGISGMTVDRPTVQLIADYLGASLGHPDRFSPAYLDSIGKGITPDQEKAASLAFDKDPRDSSTPAGMTDLLIKLLKGQLISKNSTELLLDIMTRCETGTARLRGLLPRGTLIAHKTGTIGMSTNDVGIITLPENRGHVAISVFVKSSTQPIPDRERAIAEVARLAYDYFILIP
jgi:beta-lactamase class A